jgi:hypothetical protein
VPSPARSCYGVRTRSGAEPIAAEAFFFSITIAPELSSPPGGAKMNLKQVGICRRRNTINLTLHFINIWQPSKFQYYFFKIYSFDINIWVSRSCHQRYSKMSVLSPRVLINIMCATMSRHLRLYRVKKNVFMCNC